MENPSAAANTGRFEVRVTADSHMAWVRTRLALERTMMAWLRTAVALIGFGFAIVVAVAILLVFIGLFAFFAVLLRVV